MNARIGLPARAELYGSRIGRIPAVMTLISGLFLSRVTGQVLVTHGGVEWLPEKAQWQSGLLPYPVLLAAQVAILVVMAGIAHDTWRGGGRFVVPRPRFSRIVRRASIVYCAAMIVRYVVTMALHPDWFPFEHSIPTFFHCLLATYLYLYSELLGGVADAFADSKQIFSSMETDQ